MAGWLRDAGAALADLVLPTTCPGCDQPGAAILCDVCRGEIESLSPRPTRPTPAPSGLPLCWALGDYGGPLREMLLGYKERGRHGLARPLGDLLATVVRVASDAPVLLAPIPATGAAVRARYGDHVERLARRAALRLRAEGRPAAVAPVLRARPRADSLTLDAGGRARAALTAFAPRRRAAAQAAAASGAAVVLVDDLVTTGATLAAGARVLRASGVRVEAAAVLAATRRRFTA